MLFTSTRYPSDYGYIEDKSFFQKAAKNLAEVKQHLSEAKELAAQSPNLDSLKTAAEKAGTILSRGNHPRSPPCPALDVSSENCRASRRDSERLKAAG